MEGRGKSSRREITPERERGRASVQILMQDSTRPTRLLTKPPPPPIFKKVQVVYYLSKNGLLEHPHFMEVTHLAHHHLRLKDVMDRLTILRGRGMPSLYSWSYKRSYRNGYVWNDLAENDDIISPTEGAEYILKGSELIDNTTSCTEKYHHPQVLLPDSNYNPKRKTLPPKRHCVPEEFDNTVTNRYVDEEEEEYYDEKTTYTAPNTPYSRCSIGVSTDEIELELQQNKTTHKNSTTELTQHNSSPPSTTSSSVSDKNVNENSKRFEDGDPVGADSILSRNSVLYNLIACGGSVSFRGKNKVPVVKEEEEAVVVGRKSSSLHKGVLCKSAAATVAGEDEDEIRCMSENPRFGNLQSEEKEYFSGSIVESICEEERVKGGPCLKKSSSYNEERSWKAGLENVVVEEKEAKESSSREKEKDSGKGKCLPRSRKSSTSCFSNFI